MKLYQLVDCAKTLTYPRLGPTSPWRVMKRSWPRSCRRIRSERLLRLPRRRLKSLRFRRELSGLWRLLWVVVVVVAWDPLILHSSSPKCRLEVVWAALSMADKILEVLALVGVVSDWPHLVILQLWRPTLPRRDYSWDPNKRWAACSTLSAKMKVSPMFLLYPNSQVDCPVMEMHLWLALLVPLRLNSNNNRISRRHRVPATMKLFRLLLMKRLSPLCTEMEVLRILK